MSKLDRDLAYQIQKASDTWLSFVQASQGVDPLRADDSRDNEAYLALVTTANIPTERQDAALESLRRYFDRIGDLRGQGVTMKAYDYRPVRGAMIGDPVLAVIVTSPPRRAAPLWDKIMTAFRREMDLPEDSSFPMYGITTPTEAAWCLHRLIAMAPERPSEQRMVYYLRFMKMLAERRLEFVRLVHVLYEASEALQYAPANVEWAQLTGLSGYHGRLLGGVLSVDQVRGLCATPPEEQPAQLQHLLRLIYADKLELVLHLLAEIRAKGRPEHQQFATSQLIEGIVTSRVVNEELDDQTVEIFDRGYSQD